MKIYTGRVESYDRDTFELEVYVDEVNSIVKPIVLKEAPTDGRGSGFWNGVPSGTMCKLIMHQDEFYLLGYYNLPTAGGTSGIISDEDAMPKYKIEKGEVLLSNLTGSHFIFGNERFNAFMGMGARLRLTGGISNSLNIDALRTIIDNTAGKFQWRLIGDEASDINSVWKWKIQKNFENELPSDYVESRRGSIDSGNDNWKVGIWEDEIIHHDSAGTESARVYMSMGLDDDNNYHRLDIDDLTTGAYTHTNVLGAYNTIIEVADTGRVGNINLMGDDYLNVAFDENFLFNVSNSGKLRVKSVDNIYFESTKINLGSENGEEQLPLGNTLVSKINDLITVFNSHIHPTGVGPSGPHTPPMHASIIEADVLSAVSRTD